MADEYRRSAEMMADPELQKRMLDVERQLRPAYAELNLADLRTYMGGVLGLQEQSARQSGRLEREILGAQREADIAAVEAMGGRATAALRAADPYAARMAELSQQAAERAYAQSERVTPEQMRSAQQTARMAGLARVDALETSLLWLRRFLAVRTSWPAVGLRRLKLGSWPLG